VPTTVNMQAGTADVALHDEVAEIGQAETSRPMRR
jgi:hypothetical protein